MPSVWRRIGTVIVVVLVHLVLASAMIPAGAITCMPHTATIICEMDDGSIVECDASGCTKIG